jgi:hypothetical protein
MPVPSAARYHHRRLLHCLAAVHDHGVPNDEGSRIRAQPDDSRGNLLRFAHPAHWLLRYHLRAPFIRAPGEASHHRGIDIARTDGIHADVLCGVVQGGRLGEAYHAVFGSGVGGAALDADDSCARGRVDDRAASLLEDKRNLVLHAQEHAAEINVDDPVPLVLLVVRGCSRLPGFDAGVVKGEVQSPESLNGFGQGSLHVIGPRHVAPDGDRPPAFFLDEPGSFLVALLEYVGHHHAGTLTPECQRRGATDATRCAGHERDLSHVTLFDACHAILCLNGKGKNCLLAKSYADVHVFASMGNAGKLCSIALGTLVVPSRRNEFPVLRHLFDLEPDGIQRWQEYERENRAAEGSPDQGVGQRSPKNLTLPPFIRQPVPRRIVLSLPLRFFLIVHSR